MPGRLSGGAAGGEELRAEIAEFAAKKPHPVSLEELLACLEPWRAAKFIHAEMPVRFAERIRWIEGVPIWREIPQLQRVHTIHTDAFIALRRVDRHPTLDEFTAVVARVVREQNEVVRLMAEAMLRLRERGPEYGPGFIDKFLDSFLLNRLGSNVLMSQYLALANKAHGPTGIIDPYCDATQVCREAVEDVLTICDKWVGRRPVIHVEAHSAAGRDCGTPRLAYVPGALKYIMCEILKNSCRATVEVADEDSSFFGGGMAARPINVVVCANERNVAICTSDRARGIPFDVGSQVWSYLYSTARKGKQKSRATELAGYGVGLPLSRLYARYLGGSLDLISLPGYGTHTYLFLPRLESELLEVVPDMDAKFKYHSLEDFVL